MKLRSSHPQAGTFIIVWLVVALLLAGCTGARNQADGDAKPQVGEDSETGPGQVPGVETASAAAVVQVLDSGDAQTVALQMSEALFESSPLVVLVAPGDKPGAKGEEKSSDVSAPPGGVGGTGTSTAPADETMSGEAAPVDGSGSMAAAQNAAIELGVPLLVTGEQSLQAELGRLETESLLVFGEPAAGWSSIADNREVIAAPADPAQLPVFTRAPAPAPALVLTLDTHEPVTAAALASAEAAGATVEAVSASDPRASAETIALLRKHQGKTLLAVGAGFTKTQTFTNHVQVALSAPQLPGGGQTVFPGRRMVALYGHPGTSALGVLGEQGIQDSIARAKELAATYQPYSDVPVIPAFEIITTIASAEPGADGDYSTESKVEKIEPWVDAAQEAGVYVVLDLQPGHTDFLTQAKLYKELLKRPHVGLALDPEWRLDPGERHMVQIGSVSAAEVNEVSAWLAELVRKNNLPQKVLLLHQFSLSMITDRQQLESGHSELAMVLHADGHGAPGSKLGTYNALQVGLSEDIWLGWKNFYDEDTPTFSPKMTYTDVKPKPWFVSYQ